MLSLIYLQQLLNYWGLLLIKRKYLKLTLSINSITHAHLIKRKCPPLPPNAPNINEKVTH